jgi:DNA polymerase/3'-5' exonuclease PolX
MMQQLAGNFLQRIKKIFSINSEKNKIQDYLNQSTSIMEVESKMREIERGKYYF